MAYSPSEKRLIFKKTDGDCACCGGRLLFANYGRAGSGKPGHWEVAHRHSRADGGPDHLSNLFAMHVSCNRSMGAAHADDACGVGGRRRMGLRPRRR